MAAVMKNTRTKKAKPKNLKKKKLAEKTMEEFLLDSDSDDVSSEASFTPQKSPLPSAKAQKEKTTKGALKKSKQKKQKDKTPTENTTNGTTTKSSKESLLQMKDPLDDDFSEDDDDDDDDIGNASAADSDVSEDFWEEDPDKKRKEKQIAKAKRAFEKEILNMSSGSDDSDEEEEDHFQPPEKLEVASDEESDEDESSDEGDESSDNKRTKITSSMIKNWTKQMQDSPSPEVLHQVVAALAAAAQHTGLLEEADTPYKVDGSSDFNAIMRLCLTETVPALEKLLKLRSLSDQKQVFSHKNKKWKGLKGSMKTYCTLMLQLCCELSEASMVNIVLRHIHKMVVCYPVFPKLTKVFLKKLIKLWSSGEETTRVLAFLCISKLVRLSPDTILEPALKQMYMAYVNNCKFVSPSSLPLINFMQRSLVEVFLVREDVAYQHAFLFIRQLAIHLRNAITTKKKDMCQAVYNWQYVLSIGLWSHMLSTAHPSPVLQPLIYPLVQVATGTIRLLPTARYYPLRFHCIRYLINLSAATNTFIPVLPFLLEVLEQTDFNKRPKGGSVKRLSVHTILKFSKPQLQERAFKEAVVEQLCELLIEYLHSQSHTVAFPELIIPLVVQLKDFVKRCKVPVLTRQVRQVLDKSEETAKVVEGRRRGATFNLADSRAVELWETKNKEEGNPLATFYKSWRKVKDQKIQRDIAAKDKMMTAAEEKIPVPVINRGTMKASEEERKEFSKLFGDSDDDDDDGDSSSDKDKEEEDEDEPESDSSDVEDDEEEIQSKKKTAVQNKKGQKRKQETPKAAVKSSVKRKKVDVADVDKDDMVEDFDFSDF